MKINLTKLFMTGGFAAFLSLLIINPTFAQIGGESNAITNFIAEQARINRAVESAEAGKIIRAELNNDGKPDAVVLYTLESFSGSNLYRQYLAVFVQSKNGRLRYATHKVIGGKNYRAVDLDSVREGKIKLNTLNYSSSDASCCPSRKGIAQIYFSKNKLIEAKR